MNKRRSHSSPLVLFFRISRKESLFVSKMKIFSGVPAVVDLAAMRDAVQSLGADPAKINPVCPVDLVIDHSVQVDHYGK